MARAGILNLLLSCATLRCLESSAVARGHPPIAMGVNGHPFTQPNYITGSDRVASGTAAGISFTQQFDELAVLAPAGSGTPFYYRIDIGWCACRWLLLHPAAAAAPPPSRLAACAARSLHSSCESMIRPLAAPRSSAFQMDRSRPTQRAARCSPPFSRISCGRQPHAT
jgi:hypothetical protein